MVMNDTLLNFKPLEAEGVPRLIKASYRIPELQILGYDIRDVENVSKIRQYVHQLVTK